jgi:hypothetical protein
MSFSNPLLSNAQASLATGGSDPSVLDEILGPSFDYTSAIQAPSQLGVSDDGSIGQVITNAEAITTYVDNLILNGPVGNQYFKNTGGSCIAPDGSTQNRYTYVNNRKTAADLLAPISDIAPGFGAALQDLGNDFAGILPGMFGDMVGLNPMNILNAMILDGTPQCVAYTCPVTDAAGNSTGTQTQYLTAALENDIDVCSAANAANAATESFTNRSSMTEGFANAADRPGKTGFVIACIGAFVLISMLK